jgi:chromosome segregation ATPase
MNIQDIADFIDLVKNPAKYEKILKNLQDEQARLNAAVETVGKASELDSLRKDVEKQRDKLEAVYTTKLNKLDSEYKVKLDAVEKLQSEVEAKSAEANVALQEANTQTIAAIELTQSCVLREKALSKQEKLVEAMKAELGASVTEYNEKLAKLRSVMA